MLFNIPEGNKNVLLFEVHAMRKQMIFYLYMSVQLVISFDLCAKENQLLITGSIQFPSTISKSPSLKVLYQGYKYPVEVASETQRTTRNGHFKFYIDSDCKKLYILVTENLQIPDKNNFDHLKTSPEHAYRLFKLTKYELETATKDESLKLSWSVEEIYKDGQKIILPDNTLIFFMPPSMIARLEEEPWLADQHVARLPKIVFDDTISEQNLQDIAIRMTLTLLNFELFHAQLPKRFMISDSRIIAMPYLQLRT